MVGTVALLTLQIGIQIFYLYNLCGLISDFKSAEESLKSYRTSALCSSPRINSGNGSPRCSVTGHILFSYNYPAIPNSPPRRTRRNGLIHERFCHTLNRFARLWKHWKTKREFHRIDMWPFLETKRVHFHLVNFYDNNRIFVIRPFSHARFYQLLFVTLVMWILYVRKFRKILLFCSTWNQFDQELTRSFKYVKLISIILIAIGILLVCIALCCWYSCNKARFLIAD